MEEKLAGGAWVTIIPASGGRERWPEDQEESNQGIKRRRESGGLPWPCGSPLHIEAVVRVRKVAVFMKKRGCITRRVELRTQYFDFGNLVWFH